MPSNQDSLARVIAGALRGTIHDHGPITPEWVGSAVKRVIGNLLNGREDSLAPELAQDGDEPATDEGAAEEGERMKKPEKAAGTVPATA